MIENWACTHVRARADQRYEDAGAAACWWSVCGHQYCREKEADRRRLGKRLDFIPTSAALTLYPDPNAAEHVKRLVDVGLWVAVDGGYVIVGYEATYANAEGAERPATSLSPAQLEARRAGGRARAAASNRAGGKFSSGSRSLSGGSGSAQDSRLSNDVVAKDLKGNGREPPPPAKQTLQERLQQPSSPAGEPPAARIDPLYEPIAFGQWFPSQAMLNYCKENGLSDRDFDDTKAEARDGIGHGRHDFQWFDVKFWRYIDVAIDRKRNPKRGVRAGGTGQPNTGAVKKEDYM